MLTTRLTFLEDTPKQNLTTDTTNFKISGTNDREILKKWTNRVKSLFKEDIWLRIAATVYEIKNMKMTKV